MFFSLKYLPIGSCAKLFLFSFHSLQNAFPPKATAFKFKSPSHKTFHFLLEKCSTMRELKLLHTQIILHGLTNENITMGKLIAFCAVADTGDLQYAQHVFDKMPEPNKFMYNSLIRGYSNSQEPTKAIVLCRQMICSGHLPNEFTLPFVLKACSCKSAYWEAVVVHGQAIRLGIGSQVCMQNALINAYIACGLIGCARQLFDDILDRTLVSWNSMIGGYSRTGRDKDAFVLFWEMRELGLEPDEFTLVNLLSVCSQTCHLKFGRYLHTYIEVTGVKADTYVRNALVDMYAKCGQLYSAQTIFDRMPDRNVVSWTSMVSAYADNGLIDSAWQVFYQMPVKNVVSWNAMISCLVREGRCRDALDLFSKMNISRVFPDETTLVSVLSACSHLGDLITGRKTHNYLFSSNVSPGITLYNSLIDMYAKCGRIETALEIFSEMPEKNLISWNIIIGALALHGHGYKAIELFENMQAIGVRPDEITFTGLLSACSHSGLVKMGRHYFDQMSRIYNVSCEIEHYACMVDLLGRGGLLREAIKLIGGMPMKPDHVVWGALLAACRIHANLEIGKQILKQILELKPFNGGLYVLMSNIYCEAQRWEDVKKIRILMKDQGIKKSTAISLIEIDGHVHEFMVEDKRNAISTRIYMMLDQLTDHLRSIGYQCKFSSMFLDVEGI
ncbi:pentatricopeptide repeat-containing protein At2g22410, mitochondrial-like [Malania oleifera]|uniref:pentatricopeptide repeat-containing protein At2g22410, mitochondrial-like n=1 Tax=Malania oleifera TaxID=397392 RepID=UPI0025ADCDFC|nr:pentatricopeptide repeat-containing protein At2g22410, mitochondrial-like [Malania oleifera]